MRPIWRAGLDSSTGSSLEVCSYPFCAASNALRGKALVGFTVQPNACMSPHTSIGDGSTGARMHNQYGVHCTARCSYLSTNARPWCPCGCACSLLALDSIHPFGAGWICKLLHPHRLEKVVTCKIELTVVVRSVSSPDERSLVCHFRPSPPA